MAERQHLLLGNEDMKTSKEKQLNEIKSNSREINGLIMRYILNTKTLIDSKKLKRESFGVKDNNKPHKNILLLGETGTGKSTLLNSIINYMIGVNDDYKIWCEIIETKGNQSTSITKAVTVYDVFAEASPISLSIIDTPGFGSTEGQKEDLKIVEMLHELFRSSDGVHEIDAVGLVVSAHTTRLTAGQLYVFDKVLSLFGSDVEKNIVVFVTRASRKPVNAINAITEAKIPCAKTETGEPVYFRFDNFHCENLDDEEILEDYEGVWKLINKSMKDFYDFLSKSQTVSLKLSESVLAKRKQLTASITNLLDRIKLTELKRTELQQIRSALEKHERDNKDMNNFEYEVDEPCKVKVPIESCWWHLSKKATICTVCEENCHFPGCWWVRDLSWCTVMSAGKCTVCSGRCDHTKHVKEDKLYKGTTKRVKKTMKDLKEKYETESGEAKSLIHRLEDDMKKQDQEEFRLLEECYYCVDFLEKTALKKVDEFTLQNLNFLIQKMREKGQTDKVQKLEEFKKKAEKENSLSKDEFD